MSRIRECFISRFEGGKIIEADFSQLEVWGLSILSNDPNLKKDIREGVDMHCRNAEFLYGKPYGEIYKGYNAGVSPYPQWRDDAKAPGFLIQYGGSAATMAAKTRLPKFQCQAFIDRYYTRYSRVKEWQDEVRTVVENFSWPSDKLSPKGDVIHKSVYKSITGRQYIFKEYENYRGGMSFSPTQMKNYPVQGFSTGDVVPEVLGRLHNMLTANSYHDKILLVGTVHDSIILDVEKDYVGSATSILTDVMKAVPVWMKMRFGLKIDVPVKAHIGVGDNLAEVK